MLLRPYDHLQSEAVQNLLFYAHRQHVHLDWHRPMSFLDLPGTFAFTLWDQDYLSGLIACPEPLGGTQWLRLLVVNNAADSVTVVEALLQAALDKALSHGVHALYCLSVNRWLAGHLSALRFQYLEDVVTLRRIGDRLPTLPPSPYTVQNAYLEHLTDLVEVDHAAFAPPWQMLRDELRSAQRQAASCTMATLDGQIVGYQITMRYQKSAHLSRLAVIPAHQGKGVGALLLHHVISAMLRRSVRTMTVNTQQSNHQSQRLYLRFGFRHNGYDLPVWQRPLASS
ncbi:GNAT family N-acetyltransferase [Aggregatilineales bacterium SYSU G02658]